MDNPLLHADYLGAMDKRLNIDKSNLRWMANSDPRDTVQDLLFSAANHLNVAQLELRKAVLEVSAEKS
jgi:hypothetical protein